MFSIIIIGDYNHFFFVFKFNLKNFLISVFKE